jgi:hypothetical protein
MSDLHYFHNDWIVSTDRSVSVDVCVYGASSAGVIAAIACANLGLSVALLQPGKFVGGLTTGGLGWTDFGKQHVIGGMAREFYRRVGKRHGRAEEWAFAPGDAQAVFDAWLAEAGVTPLLCQYLDRVEKSGDRISEITLRGGLRVRAKVFMDCTYEGDLLARAGCQFHVGRESNAVYGETVNGAQLEAKHQFGPGAVDPFVRSGDASSGLLPFVEPHDMRSRIGEGDHRLQAYCFRLCMTDDPALRVEWPRPDDFRPEWYELLVRWLNSAMTPYDDPLPPRPSEAPNGAKKFELLTQRTATGHQKTDTNNNGAVSSDFIGANWDWPEATFERREALFQMHISWQQGLLWTLANDPRVPARYRDVYRGWGLAGDEFTSTRGWSHTLYVREGRRLVSDYVLTEADCMHARQADDPVGMGSYQLDSHNCTRFVATTPEGVPTVMNEGDVQLQPAGPYRISYRSIVPSLRECANLLVPVCCATSHIAYGSVRMEPVFMILGESAAHAADLAIRNASAVQSVRYADLESRLTAAGQLLRL